MLTPPDWVMMRCAACKASVHILTYSESKKWVCGWEKTYPMQVLIPQPILRKLPPPLLVLDQQIQRPLQRTTQTLRIILAIRIRLPARRPLKRRLLGLPLRRSRSDTALLLRPRRLRILQQPVNLPLELALLGANEHLVVPRLLAVTLVSTNVACGRQALRHFALPLAVGGRARFEVEVPCEGQCEALIESLLVQEEGGFEGVQVACDLRGAGEQDACIDGVGG